jgi:hypothetical protein
MHKRATIVAASGFLVLSVLAGRVRKNSITLDRTDVQVVYRPTYTAPRE